MSALAGVPVFNAYSHFISQKRTCPCQPCSSRPLLIRAPVGRRTATFFISQMFLPLPWTARLLPHFLLPQIRNFHLNVALFWKSTPCAAGWNLMVRGFL